MAPLRTADETTSCTIGAQATPAVAAAEQILNSTVPLSTPFGSVNVVLNCGNELVAKPSLGETSVAAGTDVSTYHA